MRGIGGSDLLANTAGVVQIVMPSVSQSAFFNVGKMVGEGTTKKWAEPDTLTDGPFFPSDQYPAKRGWFPTLKVANSANPSSTGYSFEYLELPVHDAEEGFGYPLADLGSLQVGEANPRPYYGTTGLPYAFEIGENGTPNYVMVSLKRNFTDINDSKFTYGSGATAVSSKIEYPYWMASKTGLPSYDATTENFDNKSTGHTLPGTIQHISDWTEMGDRIGTFKAEVDRGSFSKWLDRLQPYPNTTPVVVDGVAGDEYDERALLRDTLQVLYYVNGIGLGPDNHQGLPVYMDFGNLNAFTGTGSTSDSTKFSGVYNFGTFDVYKPEKWWPEYEGAGKTVPVASYMATYTLPGSEDTTTFGLRGSMGIITQHISEGISAGDFEPIRNVRITGFVPTTATPTYPMYTSGATYRSAGVSLPVTAYYASANAASATEATAIDETGVIVKAFNDLGVDPDGHSNVWLSWENPTSYFSGTIIEFFDASSNLITEQGRDEVLPLYKVYVGPSISAFPIPDAWLPKLGLLDQYMPSTLADARPTSIVARLRTVRYGTIEDGNWVNFDESPYKQALPAVWFDTITTKMNFADVGNVRNPIEYRYNKFKQDNAVLGLPNPKTFAFADIIGDSLNANVVATKTPDQVTFEGTLYDGAALNAENEFITINWTDDTDGKLSLANGVTITTTGRFTGGTAPAPGSTLVVAPTWDTSTGVLAFTLTSASDWNAWKTALETNSQSGATAKVEFTIEIPFTYHPAGVPDGAEYSRTTKARVPVVISWTNDPYKGWPASSAVLVPQAPFDGEVVRIPELLTEVKTKLGGGDASKWNWNFDTGPVAVVAQGMDKALTDAFTTKVTGWWGVAPGADGDKLTYKWSDVRTAALVDGTTANTTYVVPDGGVSISTASPSGTTTITISKNAMELFKQRVSSTSTATGAATAWNPASRNVLSVATSTLTITYDPDGPSGDGTTNYAPRTASKQFTFALLDEGTFTGIYLGWPTLAAATGASASVPTKDIVDDIVATPGNQAASAVTAVLTPGNLAPRIIGQLGPGAPSRGENNLLGPNFNGHAGSGTTNLDTTILTFTNLDINGWAAPTAWNPATGVAKTAFNYALSRGELSFVWGTPVAALAGGDPAGSAAISSTGIKVENKKITDTTSPLYGKDTADVAITIPKASMEAFKVGTTGTAVTKIDVPLAVVYKPQEETGYARAWTKVDTFTFTVRKTYDSVWQGLLDGATVTPTPVVGTLGTIAVNSNVAAAATTVVTPDMTAVNVGGSTLAIGDFEWTASVSNVSRGNFVPDSGTATATGWPAVSNSMIVPTVTGSGTVAVQFTLSGTGVTTWGYFAPTTLSTGTVSTDDTYDVTFDLTLRGRYTPIPAATPAYRDVTLTIPVTVTVTQQ